MEYAIYPPPKHLSELVQCYWALESNQNEITPMEYFLMADGYAEIIFQYNGGFQTYSKQSARIRFQHSTCNKFVVDKELGFFGVRLYPHAVNQIMDMPASEVTNLVFDFSTLFKQEGRDLADQIFSATNAPHRVALISDFLSKRITHKKADPINHFVSSIIEQDGQVDISCLQKQSGLSVKQFERRFKAIAGFSPKYFARIARFQGAKQKFKLSQIGTLTELAYECNYYDQSHFIREFKEFSGVQPFHYFKFASKSDTVSKSIKNAAFHRERNQCNGYLPCGWFV